MIVGQAGRLQYEAVLFAASLRHADPGFKGRLILAEPQQGGKWPNNPTIRNPEIRALLEMLDVEIRPFEARHFGEGYPPGNKIEALQVLPEGEPFVFFDTDTLVTGALSQVPFDFDRPCASLRREGTWPEPELYGPGYAEIWGALYDKFDLDITPTIDESEPEEFWRRFMYFNAGWFFYSCPKAFGARFLEYTLAIRQDPPKELIGQALFPWLDQIALPLVIHSLGGARRTIPEGLLDGDVTCHYRVFPLLYARETDRVVDILETVSAPNKIKKVLKAYEPIKKMVYQRKGHKVRALFDREHLPGREQMIRNQIKKANLWMR
ncbi:hypothetical protein [Candidatus Rhodobacter oscarellae]|nr:hypothetical protein [Candidatus Rhodobacter lobularis]